MDDETGGGGGGGGAGSAEIEQGWDDVAKKVVPQPKVWTSRACLDTKFRDHEADFGVQDARQYAEMAAEFDEDPIMNHCLTKPGVSDGIEIYDPVTNTFGSYTSDGTPINFIKPTGGEKYWEKQ